MKIIILLILSTTNNITFLIITIIKCKQKQLLNKKLLLQNFHSIFGKFGRNIKQ